MAILKYARVSTEDQSLARQVAGEYDKLFTDKVSGATTSRNGLNELINYMREGDLVLIEHTDRLSRGGAGALETQLKVFSDAGVNVKFGNLADVIQAGTPMGSQNQFMLDLMASLDRQQRGKIREVAAQGIAVAKAKDVIAKAEGRFEDVKYKGRKASIDVEKLRQAILATTAYPNLDTQTKEINSGHLKVSRGRVYNEVVAMRREGLI